MISGVLEQLRADFNGQTDEKYQLSEPQYTRKQREHFAGSRAQGLNLQEQAEQRASSSRRIGEI